MAKLDEYLNKLQEIEPISTATMMVGISAANIILGATRMYKQHFTKAARMCKDLGAREKAMCLTRAKMLAKNVQLQALKGKMSTCVKSKNAERCKERLSGKIQKIATEIKFLADRFEEAKNQKFVDKS